MMVIIVDLVVVISMVVMVVLLMTLPVWSHPFHAVQEHYKEVIMILRIYPL